MRRVTAGFVGLALAACLASARAYADEPSPTPAAPAESAPPAPAEPAPPPAPPTPPAPAPAPAAEVVAGVPAPLSSEEWWNRALGLTRAPLSDAPRPAVCTWSGDILLRARGRYTEDDSDTDLYQYLRLRYRSETACGWSGSLYLRVSEDLDRIGDSGDFFVFDSIDDTYDSAVLVRPYHLYVTHRWAQGFLDQVRIGRQDVVAGDLFLMDGLSAVLRPCDNRSARFTVFGGIPTHLYESSIEGDAMVGASAYFEPWCGASVEVSDVWFQDENEVYGTPEANLATIAVTQRVGAWSTLRAGYQHLDDEPRQAWGTVDVFLPRPDLTLRGDFRTQILEEREQVYDLDPYFAILLDLQPYWDAQVSAAKGIGECWTVELGAQLRRLYDDADAGDFNHDFTRIYGTLSADGWPNSCWGGSLTGEWWRTEDGEDIASVGFEVEYDRGPRWRWTAGLDYALYRTDIYAAEERFDNYGWFLRARYRPSCRWEWDGGVRIDTDDFDTYLTVNLAARYQF